MDCNYETNLLNDFDLVIGIDEVGRGSFAGPLFLCAFIFNPHSRIIDGVNDSKKLSAKKRELLYPKLTENRYKIKSIEASEIDRLSLGTAILAGLKELILDLKSEYKGKKVKFLIDGYFKIDDSWKADIEFITKGDSKVYSIAAASVIAKVERDRFMFELAVKYPQYSFDKNAGYGTKVHRDAIRDYGFVKGLHRESFLKIGK